MVDKYYKCERCLVLSHIKDQYHENSLPNITTSGGETLILCENCYQDFRENWMYKTIGTGFIHVKGE